MDHKEFYKTEIEGRTAREIKATVKRLHSMIDVLKRKMEHPDYLGDGREYTEDIMRIEELRASINGAKRVLAKRGVRYRPTATEKRAKEFDEALEDATRITLTYTFLNGNTVSTFSVSLDGGVSFRAVVPKSGEPEMKEHKSSMEKADLLAMLSELHIGEWEKFYDNSRYGIMIVDGVVWTLTIEYKDKKRRFTSGGTNACPYNFRDLENLLGVDAYYAEDEGEDLSEED